MLNDDVQTSISESVLCWLATSSADGQPNVSPKEVFAPLGDDAIIIANIASPRSARNLRENPRACVSFINIFTQKGFQVAGRADILQPTDPDCDPGYDPDRDHVYEIAETMLLKMTQGDYPFRTIFRIAAERVSPIIAPRYKLFPATTEQDQIESAMRTYGVRPAG
ncbi:MAG: pyridoxamine 5'-phosphate oxidase family protein [Planctomycetota bacterium]